MFLYLTRKWETCLYVHTLHLDQQRYSLFYGVKYGITYIIPIFHSQMLYKECYSNFVH